MLVRDYYYFIQLHRIEPCHSKIYLSVFANRKGSNESVKQPLFYVRKFLWVQKWCVREAKALIRLSDVQADQKLCCYAPFKKVIKY